ncbi:conserved hypothetical protein [Perkinsus marinus ATCC 50983]|uniref:Deoxyhypusine monooxygenase n=1 Tax=Perkinsus marinus (strain ATCC 50983 / TXsc) TaxID=423536 RepID=C5KT80_PERM5|nr:conserved hypothetical protein [Perkinsus marinus ATCC 50983]EER12430.1 conserved hypothetical protein [Perkinsus marinus ATCC 50983]|eukprot:XP_002780635.1 conserved hypothetical protein [Perkinsus marinus ATCC 50983]
MSREFRGDDHEPTWEEVKGLLADPEAPVEKRYRALFYARSRDDSEAIEALYKVLEPETKSVLLRHEACYCIGQMEHGLEGAWKLENVMDDVNEHPMVRHEAIEGLAACGSVDSLDKIRPYLTHENEAIRDTATLAVESLENLKRTKDTDAQRSEFNTVDPIGSKARQHATKTEEAAQRLMDPKAKLSDRYAAMYQLRAATLPGSVSPDPEALKALARVLREDHTSALMRHELAFVVAQVAFDADKEMTLSSVQALIDSVKDREEACMVRHESAVALGSVGGEVATKFLRDYVQRPIDHNEDEAVVIESCKVALDAINFWSDMTTTGTEEEEEPAVAATTA